MLTLPEVRAAMLAKITASALTEQDAKRLHYTPFTAQDSATLDLPAQGAGFKLPYFTSEGRETAFYRYRYLESTQRGFAALSGRKPLRYGQTPGTLNEVYLPPLLKWSEYLAGEGPLLITEGELKAACATKFGFPTIGLGGVWCFMSTKSRIPLLPLLAKIPFTDRLIIICYDSDAVTNPDVVLAEAKLAQRLTERGARVQIARLPPSEENGGKVGLDDYLVQHGEERFKRKVLAEAFEYEPCAALHALSAKVVYVRNPGLVYSYEHDMKLSHAAFLQHAYANLWHVEAQVTKDGGEKLVRKATAKAWMEWSARAELDGLTYAPGQARVTDTGHLNLWTGWGVHAAVKGSVRPWTQLLDHLFQGAPKEVRQWFERWCAYPIQHPGTKLASAAVIWGVQQGTGKTLVGHTLMRLYGENATEVKDADLEDTRFEWAENKQFVLADDITGHDNRRLSRKFMTMITQKQLRLNPKYVPSFTIPDCINYYFTSNDPDAFYMDDADRRFFIWEVLAEKLDATLRKAFVRWRDSQEGMEALMYYMLNLPLGDFDPQAEALHTSAKREMTMINKSELGAWVYRLREDTDALLAEKLRGDLFTAEELHMLYDPLGVKRASPNALARELKRAGFRPPASGSALRTPQGMRRVYAIRNVEYWRDPKRHGEAVKHYLQHHALIPLTLVKKKY